jgi:hypothetical protein
MEAIAIATSNVTPPLKVANAVPATAPSRSGTTVTSAATSSVATAFQLLQKGNSYVSARSKDRVLQVTSGRAPVNEAPQSWRILYYDDKTTYNAVEVCFEAGAMERVHEPNRLFGLFGASSSKTLDVTKLKTDSDQAIRIAAGECAALGITVNFVELKLERGYGGLPVWNIKLFGLMPGKAAEDVSLGYVIILADDGRVLKKDITTKIDKSGLKK